MVPMIASVLEMRISRAGKNGVESPIIPQFAGVVSFVCPHLVWRTNAGEVLSHRSRQVSVIIKLAGNEALIFFEGLHCIRSK